MFSSLFVTDVSQNNINLFISSNGDVFSFGISMYGSHGFKDYNILHLTKIKDLIDIKMISCGDYHTVCLDYNGNLFSFGRNNYGQLGIGKNKNELKQTHIPQKINLPPCKQVSCGDDFTMCVTEDNKVFSFGDNSDLQLGVTRTTFSSSPVEIPDLNNIEYIVCGGYYSICKTYNNEFYSWGNNGNGQLGQGNNDNCNKPIQCLNWPDNIIDIKCMFETSLLLTSEGHVYSFGFNLHGELGLNDKTMRSINTPTLIKDIPEIQRIECGYEHAICIDINNNLWIFGHNKYGQLGLGDENIIYKPIQHPTLSNIIDISSGGNHTFVKTIDNKIYGFGKNTYSQLGIKTSKIKQFTPIQVFQDNEDIWCSFIGKSKAKSARK